MDGGAELPNAHRRVLEREARDFLIARFGAVEALQPLGGGAWSSAYGFEHAGRALVVRFGESKEWYEADRAAMAFCSPGLPVPEVLEIGDALGGAYAISVRHHGRNLEGLPAACAGVAGPMLASLLAALFAVPKHLDLPVDWHAQRPHRGLTWRGWLTGTLGDDPDQAVHGWRSRFDPDVERLYAAGEAKVRALVEACPERRDLVHGDLLHANVLVTEDASRPTAVFSWKCSVRGDFLYDVAWCDFCTVWSPWLAEVDLWGLIHREPSIRDDDVFVDDVLRHHCYEVHIGLGALSWNAWVGDDRTLRQAATRLGEVLERGPRAYVAQLPRVTGSC